MNRYVELYSLAMTPKPNRPTPWNPKMFHCTHNKQRLRIENRIQSLETLLKELDQKNEKVSRTLDEFQHFFTNFGYDNPENSVTKFVQDLREKKSKEAVILGEQYFDKQIFIVEYLELLEAIKKDALRIRCWCTKQPIGHKNF